MLACDDTLGLNVSMRPLHCAHTVLITFAFFTLHLYRRKSTPPTPSD